MYCVYYSKVTFFKYLNISFTLCMVEKVVSIRVWVFLYICNHHLEVVIPFYLCPSSDSFL